MKKPVPHPRKTLHKASSTTDSSRREMSNSTITIFAVSAASLLLGVLIALWYTNSPEGKGEAPPPAYVEFRKLEALTTVGMVVLSLDLEVPKDATEAVQKHRAELESHFKEVIAQTAPETLYSRAGKEKLARRLLEIANKDVGDDTIEGVYFGDFRIYNH